MPLGYELKLSSEKRLNGGGVTPCDARCYFGTFHNLSHVYAMLGMDFMPSIAYMHPNIQGYLAHKKPPPPLGPP